jgi:hypothetical protein
MQGCVISLRGTDYPQQASLSQPAPTNLKAKKSKMFDTLGFQSNPVFFRSRFERPVSGAETR